MSDTTPVRTVLVIGATGRIGRLVVAAALRNGLDVRALVRDVKRAAGVLPGATLVQGDLTQAVLDWKRRGERLLRASGLPYTIVRPGWFATLGGTNQAVALGQGDARHGDQVDTRQVAEALVQAVLADTAVGKTFELFAARGPAPGDWTPLFARLDADPTGSLDGAHDRPNMPIQAEPARVRDDLDRLAAHS